MASGYVSASPIRDYDILRQTDMTVLTDQVKRRIKDGWMPEGAMVPVVDKSGAIWHYQTMFIHREKPEGD